MSRFNSGARERFIQLPSGLSAPTRTAAPQINVSPRTSTGAPTGNLALVILPQTYSGSPPISYGPVTPAPGGFTLTVYRCLTTLNDWGALAPYTGLAYRDQLVLPDISGGWGLFFVLGNVLGAGSGVVILGVAELA
jgi:hypothetical protein